MNIFQIVKYFFIFFLSGIFVLVVTLYFKLGMYKKVSFKINQEPAFYVLYKKHTGAYHKIVSAIEEVENWAKENNIECIQSFGEYLDDPKNTDQDRLRSHGGCVVTSIIKNRPKDFFSRKIPEGKFLTAQFDGAPSIGPFIVYPKAEKWFEEQQMKNSDPVFEIYTVVSPKKVVTKYLFPLNSN